MVRCRSGGGGEFSRSQQIRQGGVNGVQGEMEGDRGVHDSQGRAPQCQQGGGLVVGQGQRQQQRAGKLVDV